MPIIASHCLILAHMVVMGISSEMGMRFEVKDFNFPQDKDLEECPTNHFPTFFLETKFSH